MNKELDKLKKAFAAEGQPLPDDMARKASISRAMDAFDEEFAGEHQGSVKPGRLMNTGNTVFNSIWRRLMTPISANLKPLLLGGVSLAVLSVAVLNTQHIQKNPPVMTEAEKSVLPADAPDAKPAELAEDLNFEQKSEERSRTGELRLNDVDGYSATQPKRDDAAQLHAAGDEAGSGVTSDGRVETAPAVEGSNREAGSDRKELGKVAKSNEVFGGGNKQPATKLRSMLEGEAGRDVSRVVRPNSQISGIAGNAQQSNEPAVRGPAKKFSFEAPSKDQFTLHSSRSRLGVRREAGTELDAIAPTKNAAPSVSGTIVAEHESFRRKQKSADIQNKPTYQDQGRDKFEDISPNPVKVVREEPLSTFSIDVDTASYSFMRASLNSHRLPQRDAVRVEELINYFPYAYQAPEDREAPFSTHVSVVPTPWNTHTKLMHIGIKGYELPKGERPKSNLVFLLDTSGSMNAPNKLPLLRNSFRMLLSSLQPDDSVAIVTYAGRAGTVLEPTKVRNIGKIYAALDRLRSHGSTAGAEGVRQAYQLAERNFDKDGVNRVILATDGDFNVGITDKDELKSYIERKRETGISLSVLGFGMGNYNDALMQTLAQNGNGNASYIDNLSEAQKVLVEEAGSTLFTIAKDVKIQIEFNPQTVSEYRLIGYETRLLKREDFNNDKIDAGEIGAGHTVTAIYEITPVGSQSRLVDDLRYQPTQETTVDNTSGEYALLKLRYKLPDGDTSTKIEIPVTPSYEADGIAGAPLATRFATAVAAFGQILRGGRFTGNYSYDDVIKLALSARGNDEFGYRAEFIKLVRLAKSAAAMEPLKQ